MISTEVVLLSLLTASAYTDVLLLLYTAFFIKKPERKRLRELPDITIFLVVRNEVEHIERCLESLLKLDYPSEKAQILIGDDGSTDGTTAILKSFLLKDSRLTLKHFDNIPEGYNPKAWILQQLGNDATGDYYFYTDGNTVVPLNWAKILLSAFGKTTGIVNGISVPTNGQSFFLNSQLCEWLTSQSLIAFLAQMGFPPTSYGYNMCISKEAYLNSGGFTEGLKNLTEDFYLSRQVHKERYDIVFLREAEALVLKPPKKNFVQLIGQRVRWISGALQLPFWISLLNVLRLLLLPLVIIYAFIGNLYLALTFLLVRAFTNLYVIKHVSMQLKIRVNQIGALLFEGYYFLATTISLLIFILPIETIWKGRKF